MLVGGVQYKNVPGRIGVRINKKGLVKLVRPKSPAERAGIKPGDIVKVVDGKPGDVWHIHGTPETYVNLVVRRGDTEFRVRIKRIDYRLLKHEQYDENDQERPEQSEKSQVA